MTVVMVFVTASSLYSAKNMGEVKNCWMLLT